MRSPDLKKGTHKTQGRPNQHLYVSPALERLATRLNLHGTQYDAAGGGGRAVAGQVQGADHVLALDEVCAKRQPGWDLFWAKYMRDDRARVALLGWVDSDLRRGGMGTAHYRQGLAPLVVDQFCDGKKVTGRAVHRALGVDRKRAWLRLRPVVDRTLAFLFRLEDEVARQYQRRAR